MGKVSDSISVRDGVDGPIIGALNVTFCSAGGIKGEISLEAEPARLLWEALGGAVVEAPFLVTIVPLRQ